MNYTYTQLINSDQVYCSDIYKTLALYNAVDRFDPNSVNLRSIPVDLETQKVLFNTFPYSPEYIEGVHYSYDLHGKVVDNQHIVNLNEWRFFLAYEGTLVRVFNYKDEWFLSTDKKINAFKSYWSSKYSYGELFEKSIGQSFTEFTKRLDPKHVYMFLIQSTTDNRIVCNPQEGVLHVGTYLNGTDLSLDTDIKVSKPPELSFKGLSSLIACAEACDPKENQGVIAFGKDKQFKIVSSLYRSLSTLRGNEPDILKRYFQLHDTQDLFKFRLLFSDKANVFNNFDLQFDKLAFKIHKVYMMRYLHKERVLVNNKFIHLFLCKLFRLYFTDRQKTTVEYVKKQLLKEVYEDVNNSMLFEWNYEKVSTELNKKEV